MSIGGWNEQSTHFSPMVASDTNRKTFCQSVIDVARKYNLDGIGRNAFRFFLLFILKYFLTIDIDWEYPSDYQRDQYTATIQVNSKFDLH